MNRELAEALARNESSEELAAYRQEQLDKQLQSIRSQEEALKSTAKWILRVIGRVGCSFHERINRAEEIWANLRNGDPEAHRLR